MSSAAERAAARWQRPPPPPPLSALGEWRWHPFEPCEDLVVDDLAVHIPCSVCGPYCEGPDCLCREAADG